MEKTTDKCYKNNNRKAGVRSETEAKYRDAVELYTTTDMPCRTICEQCGVSYMAFRSYLCKYHRHLLLARNGINCDPVEADNIKINPQRGQRPKTRAKYKEAIAACDNMDYIECNVSQIAHEFGLNPTNLASQLRTHYPGVIERRERERQRLGLADNLHRGAFQSTVEQYAEAVKILRTTELTLSEVAEQCGIPPRGLRQHIDFYHKDLIEKRYNVRESAKTKKKKGHITGNGRRHEPKAETQERYKDAVKLYRDTAMPVKEIAARFKIKPGPFVNYLQTWHRDAVFARRGAEYTEGAILSETKQYKRPTAAKYAPAIEKLKQTGLPTATVATEFGLHPECFRQYLKEHEPELHARQGMIKTENGRLVSARSMERYKEALHLYETTDESLNAIARRCGLNSISFGGFIRRNYPELTERRSLQKQGGADV